MDETQKVIKKLQEHSENVSAFAGDNYDKVILPYRVLLEKIMKDRSCHISEALYEGLNLAVESAKDSMDHTIGVACLSAAAYEISKEQIIKKGLI